MKTGNKDIAGRRAGGGRGDRRGEKEFSHSYETSLHDKKEKKKNSCSGGGERLARRDDAE